MAKSINEKAKSIAQQQLMGAVHAYQKGETTHPSATVKKIAGSISPGEAKKFASTSHAGLPKHVESEAWDKKADVKKLDKYGKEQKSLEQLKAERNALHSKETHTPEQSKELKRINFAIRARTGWDKPIAEDYQSGPRSSRDDTYERGTELSPQVKTATGAMTSANRKDMESQRPIAKAFGNPKDILEAYGSYGNMLHRTHRMAEIAENLSRVIESAENYLMSETNDWYDTHTLHRNIKEIKKYSTEFGKIAGEYDNLHERAQAFYEDMGHLLGRYFKSNKHENALAMPYECAGCGTRMSVNEAESHRGCPSCGETKFTVSDSLDEIKDANWLASKDRKLGTINRVQQDAEDREKHIDEIERAELYGPKDKLLGTREETFELQNEGEAPEYDRSFGDEEDHYKRQLRDTSENAMPSLVALAPVKITSDQWNKTKDGAKTTIGKGKKALVLPGGTDPSMDAGGATYVQPVEVGKQKE